MTVHNGAYLFFRLFSFQSSFFLWTTLSLFLLFFFAFIFTSLIAHICSSVIENECSALRFLLFKRGTSSSWPWEDYITISQPAFMTQEFLSHTRIPRENSSKTSRLLLFCVLRRGFPDSGAVLATIWSLILRSLPRFSSCVGFSGSALFVKSGGNRRQNRF